MFLNFLNALNKNEIILIREYVAFFFNRRICEIKSNDFFN